MSDLTKLHIDKVKERFKSYDVISVNDFVDFYRDIYEDVNKNTVRGYIYTLKNNKVIKHISRGQYVLEDFERVTSNEFVVLTMDIINSSEMNYKKFDTLLTKKIEELNVVIKDCYDIEREFFVSQGDEIQIVCPFDHKIIDLLLLTLAYLHPFKVRYGMSFGEIDSQLRRNSWEMNGPIFWNARDCLTNLKKSKDYDGLVVSEYHHVDKLCNNLLSLINKVIGKITDKQWEAIKLELSKTKLEEVLEILNISKTSYYERLKTSNVDEIINSYKTIVELMNMRRGIA